MSVSKSAILITAALAVFLSTSTEVWANDEQTISITGNHNTVINRNGISIEELRAILAEYNGAKRRADVSGTWTYGHESIVTFIAGGFTDQSLNGQVLTAGAYSYRNHGIEVSFTSHLNNSSGTFTCAPANGDRDDQLTCWTTFGTRFDLRRR